MTNVCTESLNSLIRVMNRLGRGYSFEAFRAKMVMNPVASYPHEGSEAERNFGAHIPTLIELIESGLI